MKTRCHLNSLPENPVVMGVTFSPCRFFNPRLVPALSQRCTAVGWVKYTPAQKFSNYFSQRCTDIRISVYYFHKKLLTGGRLNTGLVSQRCTTVDWVKYIPAQRFSNYFSQRCRDIQTSVYYFYKKLLTGGRLNTGLVSQRCTTVDWVKYIPAQRFSNYFSQRCRDIQTSVYYFYKNL